MIKTVKKIASGAMLTGVCGLFYAQSAFALLPIEHWSRPDGAQVWLVQSPAIPMVDVQVDFDAGSRRDPAAQAGLASAAALMSAKGVRAAGGRPAMDENQLGEAWADLGASLNADAGRDALSFSLRSLTRPELLAPAAELAARQIGEPSYPAAVWQRERARWSAAIAESDTRPGTVAGKAFAQAVYRGNPYGYETTAATLQAISVADLQSYHARYLQRCRARVAIVGALDRAQAQSLVDTLLARLPARGADGCAPLPEVPSVRPLSAPQRIDIPFNSAQAHVLIGQPGIARKDPDFLALLVGNHILGGGGFASRLMEEVREKRGLSYSVYSDFSPGLNVGGFVAGLQTRPDQAAQALQVTQQVIADFVRDGPTDAELQAAKDNLIGGFALRIDSNRKLLGNVVNIARNGLPLDYLEGWTERVQALSAEQVKAAMARVLQPERMVTVVLGAAPAATAASRP
ncbi:pitrilysin family protein [Comamonas sp. NLF-1-9]|uniref:M16 family metallopeptidase n=1 Tax=Comamonas sp. NLF-1-9 TaxID=2853163 RepID=UPI001C48F0C3|nr:pitrilysin family protein [Comamonas sp. NLF-1-9]QXL83146.1 insulinase family protein [Comamonas sp. NLF-1-9]